MDIVFGVGDGASVRRLAAQGATPVAVYLGQELVVEGISGYRVTGGADVAALAGTLFAGHVGALDLVTARHWVDDAWTGDIALRDRVLAEWWATLGSLPYDWGNSLVDGLTGIVNLMGNASRILPAPNLCDVPRLHCPVVAIGAGPSLQQHLEALRNLAGKAVLVACDAVVAGLAQAGIDPDLVTPLERLNSTARKLPGYSSAIFAGVPVVPPDACAVFEHHLAVSQPDQLYDWFYGSRITPIGTGGSTGTMAVAVALAISDGPVYLVGHDLAAVGSHHWDAAAVSAETHHVGQEVAVAGARGGAVRTSQAWARFALQIAGMAHGRRVVHVAGPDAVRIPGTELADALPEMAEDQTTLHIEATEAHEVRLWEFRKACQRLAVDIDVCRRRVKTASCLADVDVVKLMPGRNSGMLAYLLRPLWAQCGVERRLGRCEGDILAMCQQRISNVLDEFRPLLVSAAEAA